MRFLGTKDQGKVAILGVPLEATVSFRPGTRFAPIEIRKASDGIETYSPYMDADLEELSVADLGDVELPLGNLAGSLRLIRERTAEVISKRMRLLAIGGEHLATLPLVEAHAEFYGRDLAVVHIDAHTDTRDTYLGERLSHATVMRRVAELGLDVCQLGVRSGLRQEFEYSKENFLFFHPFALPDPGDLKRLLGDRPVYLTLDIDVLDPAYCPGLGTPEPGGVSYRELVDFLVGLRGLRLVGCDLVELCPIVDPTGNSAVVGASLVRELAILLHG